MNSGNPKLAVGVASAYYRATLATSAPTDGSQSNGDGNGAVLTQAEQREQAERFERFAELECRGSSPLYHQLALHVATDPEVLDLMAFARPTQRRPNLLFAAVHFLLLGGLPHRLRLFYPSLVEAPDEADPWPAFRSLCLEHRDELGTLLATRQTQTNEVRRSAALLLAFARASRFFGGRPLALVDVGASAGLNLLFDRFHYDFGPFGQTGDARSPVEIACEVRGQLPPPVPRRMSSVAQRLGIDLAPVDAMNDEDVLWLRACVWPEHHLRARLLAGAIEIARRSPPSLIAGDAFDALPPLVAEIPPELPLAIFHTATVTYIDEERRPEFERLMGRFARERPVVWVSLEGFEASPVSTLTTAEEVQTRQAAGLLGLARFNRTERVDHLLAFVDMHGSWLEWLDRRT